MKFPCAVSIIISAILSIASYGADLKQRKIIIPQDVHKNWADNAIIGDYPAVIHEELRKQLAEKNFEVITMSRREVLEKGAENDLVLEADVLGGGLSAYKKSIRLKVVFYKLLGKKPTHGTEYYSDYDVDSKGIRSQWEGEEFLTFDIEISGKNEQKLKEIIPAALKKALKKNKFPVCKAQ